jgi:hypothetical protein
LFRIEGLVALERLEERFFNKLVGLEHAASVARKATARPALKSREISVAQGVSRLAVPLLRPVEEHDGREV